MTSGTLRWGAGKCEPDFFKYAVYDVETMYCKNCGAEIDSNARFCPSCGFDQGSPGAYAPPGSGSQYGGQSGSSWNFTDSSSAELEKKSMITGFIVMLVLSLLLGLLWAVIIGIVLLVLYILVKKDIGPVKGAAIGGLIGLVVGYVINLLVFGALVSMMY